LKAQVVVDVSVALTWCFEDEMTPAGQALLTQIQDLGIVVPALWHTELANALIVGEKRQRIDAPAIEAFLTILRDLRIETDHAQEVDRISRLIVTARRHGLTAYDAAYLELAERLGAMLATHDKALQRAAGDAGVRLMMA
jgi:predicted nucleic acid-binding protein